MAEGITVRTPSRLHFGLFGWGASARRQFGGVGLMIEEPGLVIRVERAGGWAARGPLAERAMAIGRVVEGEVGVGPLAIEVVKAPPLHVGLGVGTQLSLAMARAVAGLAGIEADVTTLARWTGRGRRSGIGIFGFAEGGFLIDAGTRAGGGVPTRLVRAAFPEEWWVLIVIPGHEAGLHGAEEVDAFGRIGDVPAGVTDRLCGLVLLGVYPALLERDLGGFGEALGEVQRTVGDIFAPAQGGRYSHGASGALLERMAGLGLKGVGQSSWGPTLYGFSDEEPGRRAVIARALAEEGPGMTVFWTRASAGGARVEGQAATESGEASSASSS